MRIAILAFGLISLVGMFPKVHWDDPPNKKHIVFEGTVLKIGAPRPASGQFIFYRLAKYQVDHVCKGSYPKDEIVVEHLSLFPAEELKGVKVGDRVCVAVDPAEEREIGTHTYEPGLREESEKVDTFYFGGGVVPVKTHPCECEKEAIYYLSHRNERK